MGHPTGRQNQNHMILSEMTSQVPEELTFQSKLRGAVFNAVNESDVKEVVEGIVKRAKAGDRHAITHLFDHVLGGKQPVKIIQNNYYEGQPPTGDIVDEESAPAGSAERVEQLRRRAAGGKSLFPRSA